MIKPLLSLLIVFLSILGIADAGYLTYEKLSGSVPVCGPGFDCGTVLNSPYANIGPVPLSVLGLLYYATIFSFALMHYLAVDLKKLNQTLRLPYNFSPLHFLQVFSTFGALFSVYLVILMGVIIAAWCQFCLYSAIISALIWLIVVAYTHLVEKQPPALLKWLWFRFCHLGYRHLAKPLFFQFDPELVHETISATGATLGRVPVLAKLTGLFFNYRHPKIEKTLAGIAFPGPVGLSAGYDYNGTLTQILPSVGFGFHTIGTVTLQSYGGNPKPAYVRLTESKGLIVNKGLKNKGARELIKALTPLRFSIPTGISIASTNKLFESTKEQMLDIVTCFKLFENSRVKHAYYELNISCPNTFGGEPFTVPDRLEKLLTAVDNLHLSRPVFVKMPIDQSEAETLALLQVCERHTVAGLIFGNLTKNKKNPLVTTADRKTWEQFKGNVSGKPTWDLSNGWIKLTKERYGERFVIIGTGGIFSAADAATKLALGADLVQLITGMIFTGPQLISSINQHQAEAHAQS